MIFNFMKERKDEQVLARQPVKRQIGRAIELLRMDRNFRNYIIMQSTLVWAGAAIPFYAIYVQRELGGSKSFVAVYLAVVTITSLFGNLVLGKLSKSIGYRKILRICIIAGVIAAAGTLILTFVEKPLQIDPLTASYALIPVFIFVAIRKTALGIGSDSLLLEIAPPEERSLYIGFTNTFMGIILLSMGLSGVILEGFGFQALVVLTILMSGISLFYIFRIENNR